MKVAIVNLRVLGKSLGNFDRMSKYLEGKCFVITKIQQKRSVIFVSELAYSLHLGSDKNRKNVSREKAKTNNSGTT